MRRLFMTMVALLATIATYANSEPQKPLYIINGKVATIDEVKNLGDDLESMTVLTNKKDVKEFEHLGDTSNGVIVITLKDTEEEDLPFIYADVMPQFMGGDLLAFRSWVMQNVRYPETAMKEGKEDMVVVQFIVNRHGYIDYDRINVLQSEYPDIFAEEVKRVISSSPRWTPGSDGLVLTGPISSNMAEALDICYNSIAEPKILVVCGSEAISGGLYADSPAVDRSFLDKYHVDLWLPGAPTHPLCFIDGITKLRK